MNAEELLKITIKNETKIEFLLKNCQSSAEVGGSYISHFGYLSTESISALGVMGLRVRKSAGQFGEPVYIISWD